MSPGVSRGHRRAAAGRPGSGAARRRARPGGRRSPHALATVVGAEGDLAHAEADRGDAQGRLPGVRHGGGPEEQCRASSACPSASPRKGRLRCRKPGELSCRCPPAGRHGRRPPPLGAARAGRGAPRRAAPAHPFRPSDLPAARRPARGLAAAGAPPADPPPGRRGSAAGPVGSAPPPARAPRRPRPLDPLAVRPPPPDARDAGECRPPRSRPPGGRRRRRGAARRAESRAVRPGGLRLCRAPPATSGGARRVGAAGGRERAAPDGGSGRSRWESGRGSSWRGASGPARAATSPTSRRWRPRPTRCCPSSDSWPTPAKKRRSLRVAAMTPHRQEADGAAARHAGDGASREAYRQRCKVGTVTRR
jgi:hypothetical protein